MEKNKRGSRKVEFYTLLPQIRKMYEGGLVVAKTIHDELFAAGKISMSYRQFALYFKKELGGKKPAPTPKKKNEKIILSVLPIDLAKVYANANSSGGK